MLDVFLLLGLLAQYPTYTPEAVVNAASGRPDCWSPNSIGVIYGANLTHGGPIDASYGRELLTEVNDTLVYLNREPLPLFYVSATQINFWIPAHLSPQRQTLRVLNSGFSGPLVTLDLVPACPELFSDAQGFVAASHPDGSVVTAAQPARPGGVVVLYGTGFGPTLARDARAQRPLGADPLVASASFGVDLDGQPAPGANLWYVGLTPGFPGLYQVNVRLPDWTPPNPAVRVRAGSAASARPVRLAVQPASSGNPTAEPRVLH